MPKIPKTEPYPALFLNIGHWPSIPWSFGNSSLVITLYLSSSGRICGWFAFCTLHSTFTPLPPVYHPREIPGKSGKLLDLFDHLEPSAAGFATFATKTGKSKRQGREAQSRNFSIPAS
jgi:hypothetical protein